jgi:hypothetical protein
MLHLGLLGDYEMVQQFDTRREIVEQGYLPGFGYVLYDAAYFIFKRRAPSVGN